MKKHCFVPFLFKIRHLFVILMVCVFVRNSYSQTLYDRIPVNKGCSGLKNPVNFDNWGWAAGTRTQSQLNLSTPPESFTPLGLDKYNQSLGVNCVGNDKSPYRFKICYSSDSPDANVLNCVNLPAVPPGHSSSIRLGNSCSGAQDEALYYQMKVDDPLLLIHYAMVVEEPVSLYHPDSLRPFFSVNIRDLEGNLIDLCNQMILNESDTDTTWKKCAHEEVGIHYLFAYKEWDIAYIDLSPYVGDTVILEFITADCFQDIGSSTHSGYAYFAAECNPLMSLSSACISGEGEVIATVTAPSDIKCNWHIKENAFISGNGMPIEGLRGKKNTLELHQGDFDLFPNNGGELTCVCVYPSLNTSIACESSLLINVANLRPKVAIQNENLCGNRVVLLNESQPSTTDPGGLIDNTKTRWYMGDSQVINALDTVYHTYASAGRKKITLFVESYSGCNSEESMNIDLLEPIHIEIENKQEIYCVGDVVALKAKGAQSFEWYVGPDSVYYIGNTIHHKINPDDTIFIVKGKSVQGCYDEIQEKITIDKPSPIVLTASSKVICPQDLVSINVSSSVQMEQISWSTSPTGLPVMENGPVYSPRLNKTTTLYVEVNTGVVCNAKDSITVYVINAEIESNTSEVCPDTLITLIAKSEERQFINEFNWIAETDGEKINLGNKDTISVKLTETTTFFLTVQGNSTSNYCNAGEKEISKTILFYPLPELSLEKKPYFIDMMEPTMLFDDHSTNRYTSFWDFGDGNVSHSKIWAHSFSKEFLKSKDSTEINLISYNKLGCPKDTHFFVPIRDFEISFPTAFTPDQNNNQVFKPFFKNSNIEDYQLYIYNRWGELVFESKNINEGWDGKNGMGANCDVGSYVWIYHCMRPENRRTYTQKGSVILIR